jgi:hypothetical protein
MMAYGLLESCWGCWTEGLLKESGVSIKVVRPHDRVGGRESTVDELLASEVAKLKETATGALSLMDDEEMGGVTETETDSESVTTSLSDC